MPQYTTTAPELHAHTFSAGDIKEAALIAAGKLAQATNGKAALTSADIDGEFASCVISLTTEKEAWQDGERVMKPQTETRRMMVKRS